ncbi:MAG: hypothetical protein HYU39_02285 [Thaumarchaeota archaeon]|nr:hypothetical protein [Nitrososphaerota archaeon]
MKPINPPVGIDIDTVAGQEWLLHRIAEILATEHDLTTLDMKRLRLLKQVTRERLRVMLASGSVS